jgi:hypothetical protein
MREGSGSASVTSNQVVLDMHHTSIGLNREREGKVRIVKTTNIIMGQKINPAKQERAKQLRREMTPEEKKLWFYLRNVSVK